MESSSRIVHKMAPCAANAFVRKLLAVGGNDPLGADYAGIENHFADAMNDLFCEGPDLPAVRWAKRNTVHISAPLFGILLPEMKFVWGEASLTVDGNAEFSVVEMQKWLTGKITGWINLHGIADDVTSILAEHADVEMKIFYEIHNGGRGHVTRHAGEHYRAEEG